MRSQIVQSDEDSGLRLQSPVCYPFVKWAGGKSQLLDRLNDYVPKFSRYFEPFLGGGAMYFRLASERNIRFDAFLSDTNKELVNSYIVVRDSVDALVQNLKIHQENYRAAPHQYYYDLRACIKPLNNLESAGRFITLNKTCYNGLYRVNKSGLFNVPMGRYRNPVICDAKNLKNASTILRLSKSKLMAGDYKKILLTYTSKSDFVYLDPPYNPISSTANFTGYTNTGFHDSDQKELAAVFKLLDKKGCNVLLSNSDSQLIRKLYREYYDYIVSVDANRAINSKGNKRSGHRELLIRNYR
jgi:DNA adenine methylase